MSCKFFELFLVFFILQSISCIYIPQSKFVNDEDPVVEIKNGQIRGLNLLTYNQTKYFGFKGVPYAEPPVGELRFEPPVPVENWDGIFNATTYPRACVQFSWNISLQVDEDCLYLNVFTPNISRNANLPVIVYFHGGAFESGDTNRLGPDNFIHQNAVIVTFNYRLTIFGFFTTNDEAAPGNMGLKDQILVLKWVNENIAAFGGDPNSVTLQGQTAGAASINYLMQCEQTKGLYRNVIMQSGSALNPWSLSRNPRNAAFAVATILGIRTNDTEEILAELKKVSTFDLFTASVTIRGTDLFTNPSAAGLLFLPTIEPEHENAVITEKSYENLAKGKFNRVPVLIGYNSLEMLHFYTYINLIELHLNMVYLLNPSNFCPIDMNIKNDTIKYEIGKNISDFYNMAVGQEMKDESVLQYLSDDQYVRSIHKTAELMSNYTTVYYYKNSYKGNLNQQWPIEGVGFGEELPFLFTNENKMPKTDRDILMSQRMIKLWTNFAKHNTPTPDGIWDPILERVVWFTFKPNQQNYMELNDDLVGGVNADEIVIKFWNEIYSLGHRPFDTY